MTVYACCRTAVVTTAPSASVQTVADLMKEKNVGSVVITEDEKPSGIITDRDIVTRVVASGRNPDATRVGEVMTKEPAVLTINMGLLEGMEYMRTRAVRRLPVIDEEGKLQGIITIDDIVRLLVEEMNCITDVIEKECRSI